MVVAQKGEEYWFQGEDGQIQKRRGKISQITTELRTVLRWAEMGE